MKHCSKSAGKPSEPSTEPSQEPSTEPSPTEEPTAEPTPTPPPDGCARGFRWRETNPADHVCVTRDTVDQARFDESQADLRWTNGDFGPHTCIPGYVWREAYVGDDICVTGEVRARTALDNERGPFRLWKIADGKVRNIPGKPSEEPLSFTADGTKLFTMHLADHTIQVDRIDLASGQRELWTKITPEQRPVYYSVVLDADGSQITYSTNSDSSDLYVLEPPAAAPTK